MDPSQSQVGLKALEGLKRAQYVMVTELLMMPSVLERGTNTSCTSPIFRAMFVDRSCGTCDVKEIVILEYV